jgi:hypothetical protein
VSNDFEEKTVMHEKRRITGEEGMIPYSFLSWFRFLR